MTKYQYDEKTSPWYWQLADTSDIDDIVALARLNFEHEIQGILHSDEPWFRFQLDQGMCRQRHHQALELITVARDKTTRRLLAYAWIGRGSKSPFSQDEMAEAKILHLDLTQSARQRIMLATQAITHWQHWARACEIPVLVSTSIRREQTTFMRLHQQLGFDVRGSIAYKRITK